MFTGIIEETGRVVSFSAAADAWKLQVTARLVPADLGLEVGSVWTMTTLADTWARELSLTVKPSRSKIGRAHV